MKSDDIISPIDPQPPEGIKYMLGGESWLSDEEQSPKRLHCEEWGNLGPAELDSDIKPNKVGFRVRFASLLAPAGANGFAHVDGVYYWTKSSCWDKHLRLTH